MSAKKDDDNAKKRLNELDKEKEKLQNQLRQSIKKNKELLAQLRAKKELEEKIEEEKNTTIELQMLVNVCKTEIEEAKENNGEHSHD
ncbi:hypothetical protein TRFO_23827 [Tritrichomonas foetus]|uniref:Uncharacterized protein n=1 Tax=Tritrichomonas foetus TaxID=1144522 RepID=A0A1J4K8R3_9EUKA|nr:hypothetical protein TRFO_23827 [Tritrichomonas foetus]|eukprot:OHT07799.1 hypothetical protein TRFO_23827 [Tritrichomonas foetus]